MNDEIKRLEEMIAQSSRIVAFTGAGVSTESGIKDFRSPDGLYNEKIRANRRVSTEIYPLDLRLA